MAHAVLTQEQKLALQDAHLSNVEGGLKEACDMGSFGTRWVGSSKGQTHRNSTVHFLHTSGFLERLGDAPVRTATITELGLLELDCSGAVA